MVYKGSTVIAWALALILNIVPVGAQTVNQGATPDNPDIIVDFDVDNPNVVIYAQLPGAPGANSTSAHAEFTLNGTGSAYGTFRAQALTETEWAKVDGWYLGYEGDLSSTFTARGVRANTGGVEGLTSTFASTQGLEVVGIGSPTYSGQTYTGGGLMVMGQAAAAAMPDTWVLGTGQMFNTTGSSVTLTFNTKFEQRNADGFVLGTPVANTLTVEASGSNTYSGAAETGSYDAASLGAQPNVPGFGFAMSNATLDLNSGSLQVSMQGVNRQIVGETATWYTYPTYPNGGTP